MNRAELFNRNTLGIDINWPAYFTAPMISDIKRLGTLETLNKKQNAAHKLGLPGSLCVVIEGGIKSRYTNSSGKPVITRVALPGDLFLTTKSYRQQELISIKKSRVFVLPPSVMQSLTTTYPQFWGFLSEIIQTELSISTQGILLARQSAEQKLAFYLANQSAYQKQRQQSETEYKLPLSRTEIAEYLHLTTETVSRTFSKFQCDKILTISGRDICIIQPEKLLRITNLSGMSVQQEMVMSAMPANHPNPSDQYNHQSSC